LSREIGGLWFVHMISAPGLRAMADANETAGKPRAVQLLQCTDGYGRALNSTDKAIETADFAVDG
jgi:hypothetical protein